MIPRLPILVVDPDRHTGTPTEKFVAFVKAVVEIFEDETSDFRTSAEVNPNNGSAKLFAWTKNRPPIEIETAREIAERIHSLVLAETGYAPGEVHVDAFCILRGFPEILPHAV